MRLIIGARVKSSFSNDVDRTLNRVLRDANHALDRIQPWPDSNTTQTCEWAPEMSGVGMLFRSNEPESTRARAGWMSDVNRVWAWTGVIGDQLLSQLGQFKSSDTDSICAIDSGIGSYALIGATTDSLIVQTNMHRSEAMYYTETHQAVFFSNSAAALNLIKNKGEVTYSALGVAGALIHGLPVTETTLFSGLRLVPAGTRIESRDGHDLHVIDRFPLDAPRDTSVEEVADAIAEGLVSYAQTLARGAKSVNAAVTGGKDSRLVVSTLAAAGIDFETYTNGLPESGEVKVGSEVAAALGVKQNIRVPKTDRIRGREFITAQPEVQAWQTLRSTGGLGNAFTSFPDPSRPHMLVSDSMNFGGQGGEIIRGGWARNLPLTDLGRDEALHRLRTTWLNNADLLKPLALEAVLEDLQQVFDRVSERPIRGSFEVYLKNRTGRWLATMRHGESVVNSHTTLLINNHMVWTMLQAPDDVLIGEKLEHSVMSRLVPNIVDIPFFRDRWAFEKNAPNEFYSPETWASREPYTAYDKPRANFNWRKAYSDSLIKFFKTYLLDNSSSLLFDVVDRHSVESMLNGVRYRPTTAWALFSTQYALNGEWLADRPGHAETIEIEVPS